MRPVVARQYELIDWMKTEPPLSEVRSILRSLPSKVLFCSSLSKRELLKEIPVSSNQLFQELLISLLNSLIVIESETPDALEDETLRQITGVSFPDFVDSKQLDQAIQHHSEGLRVGESRDLGFERLFGHLLSVATTIEIVDRFFGEKLAEGEEVTQWLISQLSLRSQCTIRIRTELPSEGKAGQLSFVERVEGSLVASQKVPLNGSDLNPIHLNFFAKMPHNRYFRIQFKGGAIYCSIDHGVDAFKDDPVSEPEPVKELTAELFADVSKSTKWRPESVDKLANLKPQTLTGRSEAILIRGPRWLSG